MAGMLNVTCELCRTHSPTMQCSCEGRIYLCDACFVVHRSQTPRLLHQISQADTDPRLSLYQQRCEDLAAGREELLSNLEAVDQCCEQLSQAIDYLVLQAHQFRDSELARLQTHKAALSRDIQESLDEAQSTLQLDETQVRGKYTRHLRSFQKGSLLLFKFDLDLSFVDVCLRYLLRTNISHPLPTTQPRETRKQPGPAPALLCTLGSDRLSLYDFTYCQWSKAVTLHTQLVLDEGSRWTTVDASRVFVCGKTLAATNDEALAQRAYFVFRTGEVQTLPNMLRGHDSPGVVLWRQSAFVFGGFFAASEEAGKSSESLCMDTLVWKQGPSMQERRYNFNPVVWREAIYLCGGWTAAVEVCDGISVKALQVSLPECIVGTLSFVRGTELAVISETYLTLIAPDLTCRHLPRLKSDPFSQCAPVLNGDYLYCECLGKIRKYSPVSGERIN